MLRNGLTHRRANRWCFSSASLLGVFILFLCLFAGALSSLAHAANQSGLLPAQRLQISGDSEQAYLLRLYYLSRHDRNAEAYQLGVAAAAVYPHSATMRLMTAFAAINTQRCALARPHLDRIARLTTRADLISRRDSLRLACDGAWRRSIDLSMMMGYRPSILGQSRQRIIHAEPGSDLYRLCAALKGLCNPDRPFLIPGQRDNGVDIWFQATVNHRWRPDSKWQANLSPIVFRRYATRGGLQCSGIMMRNQLTYHASNSLAAFVTLEAGSSNFGIGRGVEPVRQFHKSGLTGLRGRPVPQLWPGMTAGISARKLRLGTNLYSMRQTETRLDFDAVLTEGLVMGIFKARLTAKTTTPHVSAASVTRKLGISIRHDLTSVVTVQLAAERKKERLRKRRLYLAMPHSVRTRHLILDAIFVQPKNKNVKVVVTLAREKIASPDPVDLKSQQTATLRIIWSIAE